MRSFTINYWQVSIDLIADPLCPLTHAFSLYKLLTCLWGSLIGDPLTLTLIDDELSASTWGVLIGGPLHSLTLTLSDDELSVCLWRS